MRRARARTGALLALTWLVLLPSASAAKALEQPRLILQITVDALRGDLPARHLNQMGEGGFRYLLEQGIHY